METWYDMVHVVDQAFEQDNSSADSQKTKMSVAELPLAICPSNLTSSYRVQQSAFAIDLHN